MLWVKAFHIISVVTWFAALFYLPRLFVYHAMTEAEDTTSDEHFKIMERKLYRGIMMPSMVMTVLFGGWLVSYSSPEVLAQTHWLHAKLTLVFILIAYHFYCGRIVKQFRDNLNQRSHVFYRWFNEFPVLLLIAIVILAVVRPF
jgi:putative membrane protein